MRGVVTEATLRRSGRVLLVAFALTIGSFIVASLVAELSERGIYEAADRIVTHSSPSVSHLAGVLTALRHLEVELEDAADRSALDRGAIDRARDQLLDEWQAYLRMPAFADEHTLWPGVSADLHVVSELIGRIAALLESADRAGARRAIATELKPAVDRVDAAVAGLRALNVAREGALGARIATLRRRSITLAITLGLASLLLGTLAAAFAVRIVRQGTLLLVRRADELETFAGRVAHDVKSPLSAVSLALDMIRRKVAADPVLEAAVQRGRRGVDRVVATVDALLAFAGASAGPTPGARADVAEVLEGVLDDLRPVAEQQQIVLSATEVAPCRLACSSGLLGTLFSNLIGNALKYMGDAPVRRVSVRVGPVDDRVHIDVEDTGPGIRTDLRDRIFDPYVRAPDATVPGIGLGLATVRRVVEAHGGRVGVESEEGRGSRFWVELPRAVAALAILVCGLTAGTARAQTWRRPPPTYGPASSAAPPRADIVIERHHARATVALSGLLDGPVAIDRHGHVSFLTDDGVLAQLAPDGNLRWSLLVGPPGGEPALGSDGMLYTAGRDQRLYAIDDDGRLLWTRWLGGRPVHGVAVGPDRLAVALDSGDLEIWLRDGRPIARIRLGAVPSAAAVLVGPSRAVVPLSSGQVVAVDGDRIAWRTSVAAAAIGPLALDVGGGILAGAADGTVARLRPDGTIAWRKPVGGRVTRSPALAADGTIFVAEGVVVVAIAPTGDVRWRRDLHRAIVAGPLVADDGSVYVALAPAADGHDAGQIRALATGADRVIALPAAPTRGLALDAGRLWVGLRDLTLRRIAVPQRALARSSWAKARGDRDNAGFLALPVTPGSGETPRSPAGCR